MKRMMAAVLGAVLGALCLLPGPAYAQKDTVAIGMTLVLGSSFVYGSAIVGPGAAAEAMFVGVLGMAILMIVFVRQLRAL